MNDLLKKYNDYSKLIDSKLIYYLDNGYTIEVTIKEEYFPHLLGLHKLIDIQIINEWKNRKNCKINNKEIIRRIKDESLSDSLVKKSSFFFLIKDRYCTFSYNCMMSLIYSDVIIKFNPNLIHSKLTSDYILFEKSKNGGYNHLAIGINKDSKERYIETFFHEKTNKYINGQITAKIVRYQMLNNKGIIIFEDIFD